MRKQHDDVVNIYREFGVKVFYVENQREDRPNAIFCRDLMFVTPEGAILTRPGMAARRGEERYIAEALGKLGVPILRTITGDGMFEGANAMWVDRHTCVVSTGSRCNGSGYEQVKYELNRMGVEVYHMQQPYSNIHIDGLMNPLSNEAVLIHASQVPYDIIDMLKKKGFQIFGSAVQDGSERVLRLQFCRSGTRAHFDAGRESSHTGIIGEEWNQSADGRYF